jgi:hypothetical protein
MHQPIERPSRVRRGLPRVYDAVVMRALSRAPELRIPTARELGHALLDATAADGKLVHRAEVATWLSELFEGGERFQSSRDRVRQRSALCTGSDDEAPLTPVTCPSGRSMVSAEDTVEEPGVAVVTVRDGQDLEGGWPRASVWRGAVILLLLVNVVLQFLLASG